MQEYRAQQNNTAVDMPFESRLDVFKSARVKAFSRERKSL